MDQPAKKPMTKKNKIIAGIVAAFLLILFGHMISGPATPPQGQVSAAAQAAADKAGADWTLTPRAPLPDPYVDDQGVAHCQLYIQCAPNPMAAAAPIAVAAPVVEPTPQVIDPKVLGNAVDSNKARAASEWDGKLVQFTAEVTDISTAFTPSVSFGKVTGQAFSLIQIACYPGDEAALIPFSKGQKATVRGVVKVGYIGVIELNDCQKVG